MSETHEMRRLQKLMDRLQARTNHEGSPLPGYKQNVAALRAEIAQLQENMGIKDGE